MTVLETLRRGFEKKHAVAPKAALQMLARRHVGGKEATQAELEAIIVRGTRPKLVCPVSDAHKNVDYGKPDAKSGRRNCVCHDCGHGWFQVVKASTVLPGDLTIDDWVTAVEEANRREELKGIAARVDASAKAETAARKRRIKAGEDRQAEQAKYDDVYDETEHAIAQGELHRREGTRAAKELLATILEPDLLAERDEIENAMLTAGNDSQLTAKLLKRRSDLVKKVIG
jgi:hypothetical protein